MDVLRWPPLQGSLFDPRGDHQELRGAEGLRVHRTHSPDLALSLVLDVVRARICESFLRLYMGQAERQPELPSRIDSGLSWANYGCYNVRAKE